MIRKFGVIRATRMTETDVITETTEVLINLNHIIRIEVTEGKTFILMTDKVRYQSTVEFEFLDQALNGARF